MSPPAPGIWRLLRRLNPLLRLRDRIWLSLAKHRSLTGHPFSALLLARFTPGYAYEGDHVYVADGAPPEIGTRRRAALARLGALFASRSPRTLSAGAELRAGLSDAALVAAYRVPFPFRDEVRRMLPVPTVMARSEGARLWDLDGNAWWDLGGSYGVNTFGVDFYKQNLDAAVAGARDLGPVLGVYHPIVVDNVRRLRAISGMDEVSFHMSGTEAVMQAVRLARYHTGRSHAVRFAGAYHGWWDGVQAGPGNPRPARDVYTLEELSERTLRVLRTRDDIAVVLVNPIQAMNPNAPPPTDGTLVSDERRFRYDRAAYAAWLRALREVCSERGIALLLDEVFLGFRLARGGAQAYFGVEADLVTWGKTLGGGLPVGVLCGKARWMRRYREGSPADLCFARGTFNAHPCVMTAMDGMLRHLDRPEVAAQYATLDATWEARAAALNGRLAEAGVPVRVGAFTAVWTTLYTQPGRYHWMFQYYLRAEGLLPAWIGSGRFIFSHATTDGEFSVIADRFVAAAEAMAADGWWWTDGALTTKRIRRTLLVELVRAKLGLRPVVGPTALPAPGPAPEAAVRAASR